MITTAQIGTLMYSTHRQPGPAEMTPPRNTPRTPEKPPIAPHAPSALTRSVPTLKLVVRMDSGAGVIRAAAPRRGVSAGLSLGEARPAHAGPHPAKTPRIRHAHTACSTGCARSRLAARLSSSRPPCHGRPLRAVAHAIAAPSLDPAPAAIDRSTGLGRRQDQETELPLTQRRAHVH
jgi:hypothetical protein